MPKIISTSQHKNPLRDIPHYLAVFQTYLGGRMYLIFALTIFAVIAEGMGLLMLLPLLAGLDGTPEATAPPTTGVGKLIQGFIETLGFSNSTVAVLAIITLAFLLKGVLTFGALGFSAYLRGQLLRELKVKLFSRYSRMNYQYYSKRDSGYFINVINEQITQTINAFQSFTNLGSQFVSMIIYLALAFTVAWRFGLMAILIGIILFRVFRRLNTYVRELSRRAAYENGVLAKLLIQTLHAFKYLVATAQMPKLQQGVSGSIKRLTSYQIRRGIAGAFTQAVREPAVVVFIMLIVLVQLVFLKQPLAPMLVSVILFYRAFNAIALIQGSFQLALDRIGSVEMVRDEFELQKVNEEKQGKEVAKSFSNSICLENVYYRYDGAPDDVLKDVTLNIPVRSSVALVGESGAGKSTLADILTLMLKPRQGKVLIDGVSSDRIYLESWRRQIGYVSQETVVFDDTIANNISLWQGDREHDLELIAQVQEAARQAYLADYIDTLPDGYDTVVGDRGLRLSGGQRQRLFIARELFRKPSLLILDEATSALDSESERAVQKSIDDLKGRITVVIIAHRLSTIRNVDEVLVFEKGKLVEKGKYEELRIAKGSRFGKLAALQAL